MDAWETLLTQSKADDARPCYHLVEKYSTDVLGVPRTASVITDQPTTYFRLTQDTLHEMRRHDPALASALDEFMLHLLAERLVSLNKTVEALL